MNKKFGFLYCLVLLTSFMFTSCNSDDDLIGNWIIAKTDFAGKPRAYAASFVIGNNLYVFGGYNGKDYMNDLWVLDTSTDDGGWTQMATPDATGRLNAIGFSDGTNGFVGTGNDNNDYLSDFWEYQPASNSWVQIADFPGGARSGCYSFELNSLGYVGGGKNDDGYYNDYYSYDSSTSSWSTTVETKGKKRAFASTFVINGVAYLFAGTNGSSYPTDMWAFNGTTWTAKRDIANETDSSFDDDYTTIVRSYASTFVLNGKGYLSCGTSGSLRTQTWEYNPTTDKWKEKTSFEQSPRQGAVGAVVNGKGAILTGVYSSTYLDDVNYFDPTSGYDKYD